MYWLSESLLGLLPTFWMSVGLGLPWALALLSSRHWHNRALVTAMALMLGPAIMTAWMLLLGVTGAQMGERLLEREWILGGSVAMAALGGWIARRKQRSAASKSERHPPFAFDEKLLIALIALAVLLRWIHTAFWPFTAYDALWVYGYQGRLYFLEGLIPHAIDYYPPFLQLQFAYVQILIGAINDHAARMVLPMLHIAGILAAYLLGERLISRRVGLIVAALWSLHPFVGRWAFIGDLELSLAAAFTLAAVFFLRAWMEKEDPHARRHEALLAGLLLGVALFTKPTAGGFIWGALLMLAIEAVRTRLQLDKLKPRFMALFWTGLACMPLGGLWYLRNLLLGHDAITWPPDFWLTQSRRSGDYLSWLALLVIVAYVSAFFLRKLTRREAATGLLGAALLLGGALASNPILFPHRFDPPASYISPLEAIAILSGVALLAWSLQRCLLKSDAILSAKSRAVISWSLLLAQPYFLTFFFSYSYHYRLGFAIVPLMLLPTAILLDRGLSAERIARWRKAARISYCAVLILLAAPGIFSTAVDVKWSRIWLADATLDSDFKKYQVFNPSLMEVVAGLWDYQRDSEQEPLIAAPGEERLPFFFPQTRIEEVPLLTIDEYDALGATHFIYGAKAQAAYRGAGIDPATVQLIAALGRDDLFALKKAHYDGYFMYELYESGDLSTRRGEPSRSFISNIHEQEILFGGNLRLLGSDAFPPMAFKGTPITLMTIWRAAEPLNADYHMNLEFFNAEAGRAEYQWRFVPAENRHGHYATQLWDAGETVNVKTILRMPSSEPLPPEDDYVLRLRVIDTTNEQSLPLTIDGIDAGDAWQLDGIYIFRS